MLAVRVLILRRFYASLILFTNLRIILTEVEPWSLLLITRCNSFKKVCLAFYIPIAKQKLRSKSLFSRSDASSNLAWMAMLFRKTYSFSPLFENTSKVFISLATYRDGYYFIWARSCTSFSASITFQKTLPILEQCLISWRLVMLLEVCFIPSRAWYKLFSLNRRDISLFLSSSNTSKRFPFSLAAADGSVAFHSNCRSSTLVWTIRTSSFKYLRV